MATNCKNAMANVKRRLTFKVYPSAAPLAAIEAQSEPLRQLYNGALQERSEAYRESSAGARKSRLIKLGEQEKSITQIRRIIQEYGNLHTHACQVVLKRLQTAYDRFFDRVRNGAEEAGFPRIKRPEPLARLWLQRTSEQLHVHAEVRRR